MTCSIEMCYRHLTPDGSTLAHWNFLSLVHRAPSQATDLLVDTVNTIMGTNSPRFKKIYDCWKNSHNQYPISAERITNLTRMAVTWHLFDYTHDKSGDEIARLYQGLQKLKANRIDYSQDRKSVIEFLSCFGVDIASLEKNFADKSLKRAISFQN